MRIPYRRGSFWPSRTQELLLRTALCDTPAGRAAWRELQTGFDLQTLAPGTLAVLPLVYRSVSRGSTEDPLLPRLKGTYRSTWVTNNLLAERLAATVGGLEAAGVDTLLVGGLAVATRYYPELALRPTATLELLIAVDAWLPALAELNRLGWTSAGADTYSGLEPMTLGNAQGQTCLLRTAPTSELSAASRVMHDASNPVEIGRCRVRALAPSDELLTACVSGGRTGPVRSVQWLVDMAQILRTVPSEVDWERVLALALAHGQSLRLREALTYLSAVLDVPVPAEVSHTLRAYSVPVRERLAFISASAPGARFGSLPAALSEHIFASRDRSLLATAATLPAFLRRRLEVDHVWQLPLVGARQARGRSSRRRERAA